MLIDEQTSEVCSSVSLLKGACRHKVWVIRAPGAAVQSSRRSARTVGHYVLGKVMGEGTFGKVHLATHTPTGEKVLTLCSSMRYEITELELL